MTMDTAGTGTSNHLVGALIQISAGITMTGVPYKGSGPALIDLLGGQVDSHVDQLTASMGYIRSGNSPAEFAAYIQQDYAKWQKVVKDANIRPE